MSRPLSQFAVVFTFCIVSLLAACSGSAMAPDTESSLPQTFATPGGIGPGGIPSEAHALESIPHEPLLIQPAERRCLAAPLQCSQPQRQVRGTGVVTSAFTKTGNFVPFDAPGAMGTPQPACGQMCGTEAYSIDSQGDIVGTYQDANVVQHGYLRNSQGSFVTFDAPHVAPSPGLNQGTVANAMNDGGVITGYYQSADLVYHAFMRNKDGSMVTFEAQGAATGPNDNVSQGTQAFSINNQGDIAGIYYDTAGQQHGFMRSANGSTTTIDPSGSIYTAITDPNGINNSDTVTGSFVDSNYLVHVFVRQPDGTFTIVDATGAGDTAGDGTFGGGANEAGTTRGYDIDNNLIAHGVLQSKTGDFTVFNDPNDSETSNAPFFQGTALFAINPTGASAGIYADKNGVYHGFQRNADGTFANFDAPGGGNGAGEGTFPFANNANGAVAGWWIDPNNLIHGFVWTAHS